MCISACSCTRVVQGVWLHVHAVYTRVRGQCPKLAVRCLPPLFCDRTSHWSEDLSCRASPLAVKLQESSLFCFPLYSTGVPGGLQDYCCPWLFIWVLCLYPLDLMLCVRLFTDGSPSCSLTLLLVIIFLLPTCLPLKNLLGLSFM